MLASIFMYVVSLLSCPAKSIKSKGKGERGYKPRGNEEYGVFRFFLGIPHVPPPPHLPTPR